MHHRAATTVFGLVLAYGAAAYVVLPGLWRHHDHQPGLGPKPALTETPDGIPGDPLNTGLVGSAADVAAALHRAGWSPADAVSLGSGIGIVASVLLDRPYADAPVSTLLYDGRRQDLAFEKPIGVSADRRHHVRLWKVLDRGAEGRPVWLGAASRDASVGFSHDTGAVTHHIAPDVDAERDGLIADLAAAATVQVVYQVSGIGPTLAARNGEGDRYHTDGEIRVAVLSPGGAPVAGPPRIIADPPLIDLKNRVWAAVADLGPVAQDD